MDKVSDPGGSATFRLTQGSSEENLRRGLGWHYAIERHGDWLYFRRLKETRHSTKIARRYAVIAGGKSDPITKSYRLTWDGQCPTLRAGTGMEKGAFQAVQTFASRKGQSHNSSRSRTDAGFPDWFVFHPTKWHSFRMLGNSVSPAVSQGLLARIVPKMHATLA